MLILMMLSRCKTTTIDGCQDGENYIGDDNVDLNDAIKVEDPRLERENKNDIGDVNDGLEVVENNI